MPASSATMGGQIATAPRARDIVRTRCLHCESPLASGQDAFCCTGCREVYGMLQGQGLLRYYELSQGAGVPARERASAKSDDKWIDLAERELAAKDGIALTSLDVDGLHCTACVWLIQELFKRSGAPGRVDVNTARGSLDLFVEPSFPLRDFVREVEAFGYRLGPKRKDRTHSGDLLLRMGIAIAVAMNAMIFSISIYAGLATGTLFTLFQYAILGLSLVSLWIGGSVFIKSAVLGLRRRVLHLDLPIALGIVLGFAGSGYAMFATAGEHAYFDTLTVFIALMLVGRFLRERVLDHNRAQLLSDAGEADLLVRRIADGQRIEVTSVADVKKGDRLLVVPGDVVPVDASLSSPQARLSFDWITGESVAKQATTGDKLPAGAANAGVQPIEVSATGAFDQSSLRELLRAPRATDRYGEVATPFESRIARVWVVLVLLFATAAFASWLTATGSVERAIFVSVALLVVTCPCAFGIATPIAHELVLGRLRREGLLVRSATFLDRLLGVRKVVFDKTGTLTTGSLGDSDAASIAALPKEQQRALYNLVARSSHPKSRAVLAALPESAQLFDPTLASEEVPGRGISLTLDGSTYRLGSEAFACPATGGPLDKDLTFSLDGRPLWRASSDETLRADAATEVEKLAALGQEVWMLTGDSDQRAHAVARAVGIPSARVVAAQSPPAKASFVRANDTRDLLMVGDGVNDALAVEAATCSGAPAAGRMFLAARTDFFLTTGGLAPIRRALVAARALRSALRRNLLVSGVYNLSAVLACFAGWMSPLVAAVIMPLSTLLSIGLVLQALGGRSPTWKS